MSFKILDAAKVVVCEVLFNSTSEQVDFVDCCDGEPEGEWMSCQEAEKQTLWYLSLGCTVSDQEQYEQLCDLALYDLSVNEGFLYTYDPTDGM